MTLLNYYAKQAGTGITVFKGNRFQRQGGRGIFSKIGNVAMPIISYLSKKLFNTGSNVADDVIEGMPLIDAVKTRGKRTLRNLAGDFAKRAAHYEQFGQGKSKAKRTKYSVGFLQRGSGGRAANSRKKLFEGKPKKNHSKKSHSKRKSNAFQKQKPVSFQTLY